MNFNGPTSGQNDLSDYEEYESVCGDYRLRLSTIRLGRNKPGKVRTFQDTKTGETITIQTNAGYPPQWYALRKTKTGWGLLYSGRVRQTAEKAIRQHAKAHRGDS